MRDTRPKILLMGGGGGWDNEEEGEEGYEGYEDDDYGDDEDGVMRIGVSHPVAQAGLRGLRLR